MDIICGLLVKMKIFFPVYSLLEVLNNRKYFSGGTRDAIQIQMLRNVVKENCLTGFKELVNINKQNLAMRL